MDYGEISLRHNEYILEVVVTAWMNLETLWSVEVYHPTSCRFRREHAQQLE